jgi:hypothetical protein
VIRLLREAIAGSGLAATVLPNELVIREFT